MGSVGKGKTYTLYHTNLDSIGHDCHRQWRSRFIIITLHVIRIWRNWIWPGKEEFLKFKQKIVHVLWDLKVADDKKWNRLNLVRFENVDAVGNDDCDFDVSLSKLQERPHSAGTRMIVVKITYVIRLVSG